MDQGYHSGIYRGLRALITGGLGFIGHSLSRRLIDLGGQVTILDNLMPTHGGQKFHAPETSRVIVGDVRDKELISELIKSNDVLFNLAGQTSHMDSMTDPYTDLTVNCNAQLSILEACRHHNPGIRIVYASTRQIYGRPDYLPVDETHPLRPVDVNGINKLAGEMYHKLYYDVYGIRSSVLRLTNTYGPAMRVKDARQTFLGLWVRQALEGKCFDVWGGDQLRDFTYIDDAVNALMMACENQVAFGNTYNLGGCEVASLREVADNLVSLTGGCYQVMEFPVNRKLIDIGDYYSSYDVCSRDLGWYPKTSLKEGLELTVEYFRNQLGKYI